MIVKPARVGSSFLFVVVLSDMVRAMALIPTCTRVQGQSQTGIYKHTI